MNEDAALPADPLVTGAEIARIAGVTRAAVSNWRRRYEDFPAPAGGGAHSPVFALADVQAWLDRQQKGREPSVEVQLWQALRGAYGDQMIGALDDVFGVLKDPSAPAPPGLPEKAVELVRALAADATVSDVASALTERFTDSVRRTGSDQVTSLRVVRALRHFAGEVAGDATLFDPACGIGSLLLTIGPADGATRYGQDLDPRSASFARSRADLTGHPKVAVATGDSLRDDQWPDLRADLVLCDPPAAVTDWGREGLLLDSRWELGTPSRAEAELAWLQHAYAHTAPGGRVLMVMPASVAYRKAGRRIRSELIRRGILTQVVALPPGTAAAHALPVHVWQLRRPQSRGDTVTSVRMIDLTGNDPDGSLEAGAGQLADVPLIDLLDDVVDLTPGRHVGESHRDHGAEYLSLRAELADQLREIVALLPSLAGGGDADVLDGPTVSVGELARAGLVEYGDPEPVSASGQLDTDYLQGFLRSASNTRRSTSASGTFRFDGKGARIPQMDITEQRRYGAAFRSLQEFETRMRRVTELSQEVTTLARVGLGSGTLVPER
ncbi:N-6 DNA methylase [Streptomyces sp. NPDC057136]|uniref:N-6 DNA methylase n=1 Tax=Streptomyces sp. NPDC057136 TaxID=3346029 RepID=UPI003638363C